MRRHTKFHREMLPFLNGPWRPSEKSLKASNVPRARKKWLKSATALFFSKKRASSGFFFSSFSIFSNAQLPPQSLSELSFFVLASVLELCTLQILPCTQQGRGTARTSTQERHDGLLRGPAAAAAVASGDGGVVGEKRRRLCCCRRQQSRCELLGARRLQGLARGAPPRRDVQVCC